jgi:hypothetical protein
MIGKLAYSLGRNDEGPNIELAEELVRSADKKGIDEIVKGLGCSLEPIANDCIKVLYEIGWREPELIADHVDVFIRLLKSKNNRLVWGGMTALSRIAPFRPDEIYCSLGAVVKAYEKGSVITVDNSITVFAELVKARQKYEKKVFPLIIRHLETCRPKEVGQHSERAFICVNRNNAGTFRNALLKRRESLADPQKKRVDRLLKKIDKLLP